MRRVHVAIAMTLSGFLLFAAGTAPAIAALPRAGETQILSVSSTGAAGDADSSDPAISADGRFVAFSSKASDLTGAGGFVRQLYVRDLASGVTTLVSAGGSGPGNGDSTKPSISDDGSVVAYISAATNIVGVARTGTPQAFVWTRATGVTTVASFSDALVTANAAITQIALSGNGQAVAFTTTADNLTSDNTYGVRQIYERNLVTRTTALVSVDTTLTPAGSPTGANDPAISSDGSLIAFASADALSGRPGNGYTQIFRREMSSRSSTELVTVNASGLAAARFSSTSPTISHDGNVIAFFSNAYDLTNQPSSGNGIYWRDMREEGTRLASPNAADGKAARGNFWLPSISADGTSIAFRSNSPDLTREGRGYGLVTQVYERDLTAGITSLVSRPTVGADAGNLDSLLPSISGDGSLVAFDSYATNLVPDAEVNTQVYLRDTTEVPEVVRIGGADRFAVSAAVSADTFGSGVPVAYVASGATFPDALSGSAAAGAQHAPVLLVGKDCIPTPVAAELHRLNPKKIIVLGGTNTIDESVQIALSGFSPTVTRIAGADRFDVSVAVSASAFGQSGESTPVAYVASGAVFPDALSGSAAAGYAGGPVLLVTKDSVPTLVAAELGRLRPGAIVVLGGTNTIDDSVTATLSRIAPTSRVAGADRFAVSANVSAGTFPVGTHTVFVASGAVFPDALSGSAAAIRRVGPVLLVTADGIPEPVKTELARLKPTRIVVLGGTATVSDAVLHDLEKYAVPPS
ncbi:WD40-like Beta Propeller Repeat [Herbiconiux ginsengi]|uniref:WD40-like Beta Propeller Repeat n=2 Tax=Herbiconiux ginsengi TaxID=381665 RepID=A0A1H3NAW6_9MICO|nr:WD40-like Beta Propeller Repeat [Herbiconiux ginsengi]